MSKLNGPHDYGSFRTRHEGQDVTTDVAVFLRMVGSVEWTVFELGMPENEAIAMAMKLDTNKALDAAAGAAARRQSFTQGTPSYPAP